LRSAGISASSGTPVNACRRVRSRIEVSRTCCANAAPIPINRPSAAPRATTNGLFGETGTADGVASRMICVPIWAPAGAGAASGAGAGAPRGAGAGSGAGAGAGPIGCCCSSAWVSPTNCSATAFAIAAACSGEVSVTDSVSTTVSGATVTVRRSASCSAVIGSLSWSTTAWVIRASVISGAYDDARSFASWLAW
jgi:hypothetical protein